MASCKQCVKSDVCFKQTMREKITPKGFELTCKNYISRKDVLELIKKQTPKKPTKYDSVPHARCPVCNCSVKLFADAHEYHFCLYCGQKLDWD